MNGVVGLKPTVGLISRTYIVPGSLAQDTAGPMARNVADVALLLTAMSGSDPADAATSLADEHKQDYVLSLKTDSLKGVRIGVMRYAAGFHLGTDHLFDQALAILKSQGATLVDVEAFPNLDKLDHLEGIVFSDEMKTQLQAYLSSLPPGHVSTRSLADLIEFNRTHPAEQVSRIGQDKFEGIESSIGVDDPRYQQAKADAHRLAGPEGIDAVLRANNIAALVAPTAAPAWLIDPVLGDRYVGRNPGKAAAVAGYPHLTVPMGYVDGLPVGLSFIGTAWSEAQLLSYGYAFEQASHVLTAPVLAPANLP
jgi:amidase